MTGVSAGIRLETARSVARRRRGRAARDGAKAPSATAPVRDAAVDGGASLERVELDLASLRSVGAAAESLLADARPFDAIIAKAGVMAMPFGRTSDGFELPNGVRSYALDLDRARQLWGTSEQPIGVV